MRAFFRRLFGKSPNQGVVEEFLRASGRLEEMSDEEVNACK